MSLCAPVPNFEALVTQIQNANINAVRDLYNTVSNGFRFMLRRKYPEPTDIDDKLYDVLLITLRTMKSS